MNYPHDVTFDSLVDNLEIAIAKLYGEKKMPELILTYVICKIDKLDVFIE